MKKFDFAILGTGCAGAFSALKITKDYANSKVLLIDVGAAFSKRKKQMIGWLGCLPSSDGKLYLNDIHSAGKLIGNEQSEKYYYYIKDFLGSFGNFPIVKDKNVSSAVNKKIEKNNFSIQLNDYIQLIPKDIHILSKQISKLLTSNKNFHYSFNNEIYQIRRDAEQNGFIISTYYEEFFCKKLIFSVGRSGWRYAAKVYKDFGIIESNDNARFGIRVEMNTQNLKEFNKSNCFLKKDNLEVGPFCWNGTVIPEDHEDIAICAFRSNENRWKSDKVSFNVISNIHCEKNGFEQTDRIGKLTFILTNDRLIKEKVSTILSEKSKISVIPEYDWLKNSIREISNIIPDLGNKAYFHIPTIMPLVPKVKLGNNLSTEINGMYCAGESAGVSGILSGMILGLAAADGMCN